MGTTGVLPFVRGIDLSNYHFQNQQFPDGISEMRGLRWLKLDRDGISTIPEALGRLQKLEHLSLAKNSLEKVHGELTELSCLRSLNLRHNRLKASGVPSQLFDLDELTTLDFSYNNLKDVPEGLEKAKSLLVLNLSNNHIETIPSQLFVQVNDLIFLDLSNNQLETLPPQTRRLGNLQTLLLDNNPLANYQLRQLPSLISLQTLSLQNTQRTLSNIPANLDNLVNLAEINLSENNLTKIPDALFTLPNLKRVNLSDNVIMELSVAIDLWTKLEVLNVSRNQLQSLPASITKITTLRRVFVNENRLEFNGIPQDMAKLDSLTLFSASDNRLESIPEGICKCKSLKKLLLANNKLLTVPDEIHNLTLDVLDLNGNPELVMPPKPVDPEKLNAQFYNIDFSLQNQLRIASGQFVQPQRASSECGESVSSAGYATDKDSTARKLRLRRGRRNEPEADQEQAKILKGLKDVAKQKEEDYQIEALKPKKWDAGISKPTLDYSEFFEEDVGQIPGLTIWEIENFLPNQVDEVVHGKFYCGDCYIVLQTFLDDVSHQLNWKIFFWIGKDATLDKRACAAIHAVNLRNYLGCNSRTIREEQGDESPEFLMLFEEGLTFIDGGRTASGFYTVDDMEYPVRLYRIHASGPSIHLEPVAVHWSSLDPRHVYLLDIGLRMFIWHGVKAKNTLKSKTRLMAEKINKNERKDKSEIIQFGQDEESLEFWRILGREDGYPPSEGFKEHVPSDFKPFTPRLYQVGLGMGYLELPQVEVSGGKLVRDLLKTKHVYILDCYNEVFVWFGRKSTRLVRAAAHKLSQELWSVVKRPEFAVVTKVAEGSETQFAKTKFVGWDDVIAVDFTRTAASVRKTGADLNTWVKKQETKVDLSALFMPRQPPMLLSEAQQLIDEWNEDLEAMEAFVLEGKKFVRLPEEEMGHFYSGDCYVFLCRYWIPGDIPEEAGAEPEEDVEDDFQCVVYFWQGRDASNMGWLTFTFSLQKKFESLFGNKLEVVRTHQQQENPKFMSHFKRKFIIHTGKRKPVKEEDWIAPSEFYQIRTNGSALCTRCIQIKLDATLLNSCFCYILKVPFDKDDTNGIIYVWIGSKASDEEAKLAEEIAQDMYDLESYSLQILNEGEEPENFFWIALGGKKQHDTDADFMQYARLFRCSNEKGYFTVSEKCSDFCQDDLADDDIMILDNGEQVFLWLGSRCSEVEVKLAYKSVQVYIQNLRIKQPEKQRLLFLTIKGKESKRFTKCFHGWSHYRLPPV
ncbi:protein flightless-1-like isoform X2 [Artemia franciscana]|uniref:Gelsolin-like domain-containing protein n=2 Tax=Artemia TaxID=6660 RepID=A0AA88I1W5_ARTSF|nr:hypothetical protein QYM36_008938 [Artemia franciscana]